MENIWGNTKYLNPRVDQTVWIYWMNEVMEAQYLGNGNYFIEKLRLKAPFEGRWLPREIPAPPVE